MYEVLHHPRAIKFLDKIDKRERHKIILKIDQLQKNSFSKALDIKRLANVKISYRLRVGKIRLIFDINESEKIIYITKIDYRGNVY